MFHLIRLIADQRVLFEALRFPILTPYIRCPLIVIGPAALGGEAMEITPGQYRSPDHWEQLSGFVTPPLADQIESPATPGLRVITPQPPGCQDVDGSTF